MTQQKEVLSEIYTKRNLHLSDDEDAPRPEEGLFERERGELFASWIGTGKTIVDLGCRFCALTRYFYKGNTTYGFDIDATSLTYCPPEVKTEQHDLNGDWHTGKEKKFDVVVSSEVVEHLFFPEKVVGRIASVLKDDGMFIGSVPNAFNLKNRIRLFFNYKELTPLAEPTHITHFGYSDLKAMLEKHFEHVEIVPIVQEKWRPLAKVFPGLASFLLSFKATKPKRPTQ